MKICPKCGKENSNNSKFCSNCRAMLNSQTGHGENRLNHMVLIAGILAMVLVIGGTVLLIRSISKTNTTDSASNTSASSNQELEPEPKAEPEPETEPEPKVEPEPETEPEPEQEPEPQHEQYTLPSIVPDEYYYYKGHTYAFYDADNYNLLTYDETSNFCHEQGGHLAVMNDSGENGFLYDLAVRKLHKTVFFGYTDKNEEGYWEWDGEGSGYENWSRSGDWDLPDNGAGWGGGEWIKGGEDYAEFNYGENPKYGQPNDSTWNDTKFMENTSVFICEWDYDMREAMQ